MSSADGSLLRADPGQTTTEYSPTRTSGPSRRREEPPHPVRGIRLFYFGLASAWGFVVGASVVAAARRFELDLEGSLVGGFAFLGAGLGVAVLGGMVAATAYRDARSRRGR